MRAVKNLVFSCVTAGLSIIILGLFADQYSLFEVLAHIPEAIEYMGVTFVVYTLLFLASLAFIAVTLIFAVLSILCDAGVIKSDGAFRGMKVATLILACFALFFMLGMLAIHIVIYAAALDTKIIVVTAMVVAIFVISIMNLAAAKAQKKD